jgi:DNA-binding GntR family transcriptional regulator
MFALDRFKVATDVVRAVGQVRYLLRQPANRAADTDVAHHLGCIPGLPVLRIDRLYRDRELRPLELSVNHFHPDRYSYRIQLRAQLDHSPW